MTGSDPWGPPAGGQGSGGWGDPPRDPRVEAPGPGWTGTGAGGPSAGGFGSGDFGSGSFGPGGGQVPAGPGAFGPGGSGPGSFGPGAFTEGGSALPRPARPPVVWLFASLAAALVGGSLAAALGTDPRWAFLGWALGGLVAIGLLAVFARADAVRRAAPVRVDYAWVPGLYIAAAACALAAVVVGALRIAFWAGRL